MISAGFDGHEKDLLGTASNIAITEFDYAWLTRELVKISNMCCEGRIVSMLEGGYNTKGGGLYSPLANSMYNHIFELSNDHNQVYYDVKTEIESRKRKYSEISQTLRNEPQPVDMLYMTR